ncbi:ABC transporter permease [Stappia sp. P2PMeth1]|uniref:ABC transporter permease n=1 Tax=Stappia sp. P2PMeth1 TaxID=2003586 RepID=UPI0016464676|nr:ABC transporter permease [Stappia sp. P2PMeth1]
MAAGFPSRAGRMVLDRALALLLVVALGFLLPRFMPGDPVELQRASDLDLGLAAAQRETLRQVMGLGGSLGEQFLTYCAALLSGDLGFSVAHAAPVSQVVAGALAWTSLLVLLAFPIYLLIGPWLGIESGLAPERPLGRGLLVGLSALGSVPPYAVSILLLWLLAVAVPLFPLGGAEALLPPADPLVRIAGVLHHAALPALALATHEIVRFFFLSRGATLALSLRPFVINARARGIAGWRLRVTYLARSLAPVLAGRLGDTLAGQFSVVLFVEIVFSYPGIGLVIHEAIRARDLALLQGAVICLAAAILVLNALLDGLAGRLARRG